MDKYKIEHFAKLIRDGKIVAFPTETVYGIGANAFDKKAIKKIFTTKRRPADNPLIVHIPTIKWLPRLTERMTPIEMQLFQKFSPGPLTLLLPKNKAIPDIVTAGSPLVGVRIPNHPIALQFIEACGVPIAAPSANISGKPSATHHDHVLEAFGEDFPVIRAGTSLYGVESTVVKVENDEKIYILRQGAISPDDIRKAFPRITVQIAGQDNHTTKASPGTRYRHYAPQAKLFVLPYDKPRNIAQSLNSMIDELPKDKKVAIMCADEVIEQLPKNDQVIYYALGPLAQPEIAMERFYAYLLKSDTDKVDHIIANLFEEKEIGGTLNDRLLRAAGV
jgi:L-threonylcarbamoyladenylate synthase